MSRTRIILLAGFVIVGTALHDIGQAQWNFNLAYDQEYNSNPFHLPDEENSWISLLEVGIEHEWESLLLGYYGSYAHFVNLTERNFYWQQLAVAGGSDTTNWGVLAEQRINRPEFKIYDYQDFDAYFNRRFFLQKFIGNWNVKVQFNRHQELPELNNWKLFTSLRLQRTLPTKTTIISQFGIDFKNYLNSDQAIEILADSSLAAPDFSLTGSTAGIESKNSGSENGKGNGGKGRGYFHGGTGGGYLSATTYANLENSSVTQFWISVRIAQSISPTFGLAVQYSHRQLLTGNDRYISGLSDSYSQESEIFDDPMGSESHSFGLELTKILPSAIAIKAAAYIDQKNYSSQGIYVDAENYEELTLRRDEAKMLDVSVKKNFNLTRNLQLSANVSFNLSENESNSYWYDYRNQYVSAGFEFQF